MRAETLTLCTMHTARNPANPGLSTSTFMWDAAWISLFFLLVFPSTQEKINMVSPLKVFVLDIASIPLSLSLFESVWLCLCLCVLTLLQSVSLPLCLCLCSPFSPPPNTHTHILFTWFLRWDKMSSSVISQGFWFSWGADFFPLIPIYI